MAYTPLSTTTLIDDRPLGPTPSLAPNFTLHRTVVGAIDSIPAGIPTSRTYGMNMIGYEKGLIHVVPKTGSPTPNIEVYQWSENAGKFVAYVPSKAFSAPAANTPYVVEIDVFDAIIWVAVLGTVGAPDSVNVLIAGSELDRNR